MAARNHTTALFAAEVQSKADDQNVLCSKMRRTRKLGEEAEVPSGGPFSNRLTSSRHLKAHQAKLSPSKSD